MTADFKARRRAAGWAGITRSPSRLERRRLRLVLAAMGLWGRERGRRSYRASCARRSTVRMQLRPVKSRSRRTSTRGRWTSMPETPAGASRRARVRWCCRTCSAGWGTPVPPSNSGSPVIEDCAQFFFLTLAGRPSGSFGLSHNDLHFYATKVVPPLARAGWSQLFFFLADRVRDLKGYDRRALDRRRYNLKIPPDLQAAVGRAQLRRLNAFIARAGGTSPHRVPCRFRAAARATNQTRRAHLLPLCDRWRG